MAFSKVVEIAGRSVGVGHPCFLVAEMSANHEGSFEKAMELVRAAKRVGADAIKLQTYRPDTITLDVNKPDFKLPKESPWAESGTLYRLYEKAFTPWEWHAPLFAEAKKLGLIAFSSPFDATAVDLLEKLDAPAYKIASLEIGDVPLLKRVAQTRKPVILSSGVAEKADIKLALDTLSAAGAERVILLKCNTSYPASDETIHLRSMRDLGDSFGVPIGFSDHTIGIGVPIAAVALGACLIEKHFILGGENESVDGFFSLDEAGFRGMVTEIRRAEAALGNEKYVLDDSSRASRYLRRSLYVTARIRKGEIFTNANVRSVRPAHGLEPRYLDEILGKPAARDLEPGDRVSWDAVELGTRKAG